MTKELAIRILRGDVLGTDEQTHEAVFMAIRALKAEPVKHGRWIEEQSEHFTCKCSACGEGTLYAVPYDIEGNAYPMHYCPNCGAKMGEVEE